MAKAPLFTSERTREWVIAAAMLGLLALSLGLAYALVVRPGPAWGDLTLDATPQRVDDLELFIPTGWRALENDRRGDSFQVARTWTDPNEPERRLLVGAILFNSPRPPLDALNAAADTAMEHGTRPPVIAPPKGLRVGPLVGLHFADAVQNEDREGFEERFIAVLTLDARRYWVICYNQPVGKDMLRDRGLRADARIFENICRRVADRSRRPALAEDYRALGLTPPAPPASPAPPGPPDPSAPEDSPDSAHPGTASGATTPAIPSGLIALVPQGAADQPIELAPGGGAGGLEIIRIRGTLDAGISDPASAVSPRGQLAAYFLDAVGRQPMAGEIARGEAGGVACWHVALIHPQRPTLVRELWYATLNEGGAMLVETLSEPRGAAQAAAHAAAVIAAFTPAAPAAATQPATAPAFAATAPATQPALSAPFVEASRRGAVLAGHVAAALEGSLAPGLTYYLISAEDGRTLGYQVNKTAAPHRGDPLELRGGSRLELPATRWQREVDWGVAPGGDRFEQITRQLVPQPNSNKAELTVHRLELKDKMLRRFGMVGTQSTLIWSGLAPASYVPPMADETWPVDSLAGIGGVALVWLSVDSNPPTPYLMQFVPADGKVEAGTDLSAAPAWELRRRPLAGMESDRLLLDAAGRVLRAELHTRGAALGESLEVFRRVDRAALLLAFPQLKAVFDKIDSSEAKP